MKKFLSALLLIHIYLFTSCDDVFPDDISGDEMTTIVPLEGDTIAGSSVQFRWSALEGADSYRLQLLDGQQMIIVDSLITGSFYDYTIEAGNYRWRVRGENSAYETSFTPLINFSVVSQ